MGIVCGWFFSTLLGGIDPASIEVTNKRALLVKLTLLIAPAESWFWIWIGIFFVAFVIGESYLRGYWPYGYWPFTREMDEEIWEKFRPDKEQMSSFMKNLRTSTNKELDQVTDSEQTEE